MFSYDEELNLRFRLLADKEAVVDMYQRMVGGEQDRERLSGLLYELKKQTDKRDVRNFHVQLAVRSKAVVQLIDAKGTMLAEGLIAKFDAKTGEVGLLEQGSAGNVEMHRCVKPIERSGAVAVDCETYFGMESLLMLKVISIPEGNEWMLCT